MQRDFCGHQKENSGAADFELGRGGKFGVVPWGAAPLNLRMLPAISREGSRQCAVSDLFAPYKSSPARAVPSDDTNDFCRSTSKGARRPSQCIERGAYSSPYTSAPTNAYQVRICFSTAASRRAFAERWPSCRDPLASSTPGPVPVFRPMSRRTLPAADWRAGPRCLESCLA